MKKLFLAAGLCVVAFVVAPVASASAEAKFIGACVISGKATFKEPATLAKTGTIAGQEYKFKSELTVCAHLSPEEAQGLAEEAVVDKGEPLEYVKDVEEVLAITSTVTGSAEVSGKGELGCVKAAGGFGGALPEFPASGAPGTGKLEVGAKVSFKFRFVSTGTEVNFQAGELGLADEDKNYTAAGEASFAADTTALQKCSLPGEGPSELKFVAATAGLI
jgi:hypothetical protein